MKPILYSSTETAFDTNGQGILSDAISCTVTEELNGMFELEMQYPVSGIHYAGIQLRSLMLAQPNPTGNPQPFRVYRLTKPLDGVVTIYAQHLSYDLSGIPVQPFSTGSAAAAMAALKTYAVGANPFEFWTDKTTTANMTVAVPSSIRGLLGGSQGSVLDVYGGQYLFDRYTVRLYARRGADRGVTIRYGKNLTSLEQDANCASVYTGVYPYWADAEGNNLVQLPEKVLPAPGTYDFTRILPLDLSGEWQEPPTQDQLRQRAQHYMQDNQIGVPTVSLTVGFVPLEQSEEYADRALLERVDLGDTVTVQFARLGVDATAKVIQTVYDVLLDRYRSVTLGDARASIADTIANQQAQIDGATKVVATIPGMLQGAVDSATAQITGNAGGYVVLHSSTGRKKPDEILIMDAETIQAAIKIWRWNKAGLGYSRNGYNGPYGLAMTQDGAINADYITVGKLTANIITVGVLQSADGKTFYLDLENGVLRMQAESLQIGGKTVDDIASEKAKDAVDAQTQQDIFNVLTNNGQEQGIYLKNGKLYINASYMDIGELNANLIHAGTISSNDGNVNFNLDEAAIDLERLAQDGVGTIRLMLKNAGLRLYDDMGAGEKELISIAATEGVQTGHMHVYTDGNICVEVGGTSGGGRVRIGDKTGKARADFGINTNTLVPYLSLYDDAQKRRLRIGLQDSTGRGSIALYNSAGETIWQVYENAAGNATVYQKTS